MAKSAWATLTADEKDILVWRRYVEEVDISVLAEELDMYPPTLERRLREWRKANEERIGHYQFGMHTVEEDSKENYKKKVDGNTAEVTGPKGRIVTLEQLLDACEVDLDEWKVDRYVVNKWEIARKGTEKNLEWNAGTLDGYSTDTGKFHTQPLFQVKAWLVKKHPIELFPIVHPTHFKVEPVRDRTRQDARAFGRSLIVPDIHVGFYRDMNTGLLTPFHDRHALSIVLSVARDLQPDTIVFLGDNLDLPDWSDKFIRSPEFRNVTQPAIDELAWWLAQFRGIVPDAEIVYLEGNHENRMVKARQSNMEAAFDVRPASRVEYPPALSVPSLLELDKLDITWIGNYPDGEFWISDDLVCVHGAKARAGGGDTAKAMLATFDTSVIFGHIHRQEMVIKARRVRDGDGTLRAVCFGALCKTDGTVPGHTNAQNWSKGFGIVYSGDDGDNIVPIEIKNGRAVFPGHLYEGFDVMPKIYQDLGHWEGL